MAASETLTIRVPPAVKAGLAELARGTRRTTSFLAAEAVADYVARELAIVAGIERGLADVAAGRLVDHEAAMDELDAAIAGVAAEEP
jgi:predicted transcriptional regulator